MNCRYQIKQFNTLKLSAQAPGSGRTEEKNYNTYQPALDYVTDSETLNLVKICC